MNCLQCNTGFEPKRKNWHKFCSSQCREKSQEIRRKATRQNVGKGGYFRNGKWIAISWGDKITTGLLAIPEINVKCTVCGNNFLARKTHAEMIKFCSQKCRFQKNYTDVEPLLKKSIIWGANLVMGIGKKDKLLGLVHSAVGKSCIYCGVNLTIENMSLDHKEAYSSTEIRRSKKENNPIRRHLDRIENLQVICRDCNSRKGDLHNVEYQALLLFLKQYPRMKGIIFNRIAMARGFLRIKRKSGSS